MHQPSIVLLSLGLLASGCNNLPHNNVLLFGTETKFGIDASSNAAAGGVPQVTVGYRRSEAAWMPLSANNFNCTGGSCGVQSAQETRTEGGTTRTGPALFQGSRSETYLNAEGETVRRTEDHDSYSVFGSFGAEFDGFGGAGGGKGGLAQFFLTGIAAQEFASRSSAADALRLEDAATAQAGAAREAAEADKATAEARLVEAEATKVRELRLSDLQKAEIRSAITARNATTSENIETIVARCGKPGDASWVQFGTAIQAMDGITDIIKIQLPLATSSDAVEEVLGDNPEDTAAIAKDIETLCPKGESE